MRNLCFSTLGVCVLLGLLQGGDAQFTPAENSTIDTCMNVFVDPTQEEALGSITLVLNGVGQKDWRRHVFDNDVVMDIFLNKSCADDTRKVLLNQFVLTNSTEPAGGGLEPIEYHKEMIGGENGKGEIATKLADETTTQPLELLVAFKCRPTNITQYFWFNVTLEFVKENTSASANFDFVKVCLPDKPIPGSPDAWAPASIFFFVIFLLITLMCIASCGYNYAVAGKHGVAMIPFAESCMAGIKQVQVNRNRTPQMNYDEPFTGNTSSQGGASTGFAAAGGETDYGGAYQSDL